MVGFGRKKIIRNYKLFSKGSHGSKETIYLGQVA